MTESSDSSESAKLAAQDDDQGIGTTIVGARAAGRGRQKPNISRGIEILVKKASVDPEFRALLLEKRGEAAREIDLTLSPAEKALLNSVPSAHIEQIIANTTVSVEHRRVFLGKVAAVMLAALGSQLEGCLVTGIRPEGMRPDRPEKLLSCKPDEVRLDPDGKLLNFEVLVQGPSSVLLAVKCDCRFQGGKVEVSFRSGETRGKTEVRHQSEWVRVTRGSGEFKVRAEGNKGTTDWLVVRLINDAVEPGEMKTELLRLPKEPYEPGEYMVGECMIYRIAKFRKEWRA